MPSSAGWTLREAIRRTVDPDLLRECVSAERNWREAGAPTRFVRHAGVTDGLNAIDTPRDESGKRALRNEQSITTLAVTDALRSHLLSGQLIASGRRGSPLAEHLPIPSSAWKILKFKSFKRSIATEPGPTKTPVHDVRIVPALYQHDVVAQLDDEPLVQAFNRFVFNDPQVASLRKRAIAHGGKPRTVGFQSRLYHAYWYVAHGTISDDDPVGYLLDGDDAPLARVADRALQDRFCRIVQLLQNGTLVAEGAPRGQGTPIAIPRAMWLRQGAVLDLYKGDYYDHYPDPGADDEDRTAPLYLSLMLRRPNSSPTEMLHVKPIQRDGIPASATVFSAKGRGKGARGAVGQQRIEDECREWLVGLMKDSPSKRTATNEKLLATAREKWGISERSFAMARKLAITETGATAWRVAGASPKSPRDNRRGD